jgi:GNAT superfamily N-acetyltransferase
VSAVRFPEGYRLELLHRRHPRRGFRSGEGKVDDWLASKALQHQEKRLSVTKALLDEAGAIAGYYTLATGQVDFADLPFDLSKGLPRRLLPVAVLAWLGVNLDHQGRGLGLALLAQALRDCYEAGQSFAFIAVILDCVNDSARAFYRRWDFHDLPGHANRMYLSAKLLEAMVKGS